MHLITIILCIFSQSVDFHFMKIVKYLFVPSFRETRPDEPVPPGRKFMRMELPAGRTSPTGRKSPNGEISVEKEAGKSELNPVDSQPVLDAEDSVPAGWKIAKFGSDLDLLLTSPQVTNG